VEDHTPEYFEISKICYVRVQNIIKDGAYDEVPEGHVNEASSFILILNIMRR